jgi:adenylate cyclase
MTAAAPTVVGGVRARDRAALLRDLTMHFGACMVLANLAGGAIVFLFLGLVLPTAERSFLPNIIALAAYLPFSVVVGCLVSTRAFRPIHEWVSSERPLTTHDRTYVVRHPLRQALINFAIWMGSEVVFIPLNVKFGWVNDLDVAHTILMGAITTCGLTYLFAERMLRPINELAFESELPTQRYVPGVKSRILLAWAVGSGIPLLGVVSIATDNRQHVSLAALGFLGSVGLVTGAVAILFAAKSIADPIESVRSALASVQDDNLNVQVPVYDGSQVGQLQNGFNEMVEGLRDRRMLRDLFGRQVGADVARQAVERGVRLGGEQVHAAVLFVDVIGSTEMAATRPAAEVVAALNSFFAVVVDVVDRAGGFVNKFEGDAALCIFGAPVQRDDCAACALLAARLLRDRLTDVRGLSAAIGVSAGNVVAGNIGTRERFEYTVIGDPVNEAARLTELAQQRPERLLISASLLDLVPDEERRHWHPEGTTTLRGRTQPTKLALPA